MKKFLQLIFRLNLSASHLIRLTLILQTIGLVSVGFEGVAISGQWPDPRFEAQQIGSLEKGYGLSTGDVDGDGKLDVLLADRETFVWFRNGDWKRFVLADRL
ncbi:MAG: VCBS repeat-containing protein, partial [Verrucomicrobia bacterium]|nr:VCBS repeat-containing protein [Verrucomicrobiota bacterium]